MRSKALLSKSNASNYRSGFTLIELLVVIGIMIAIGAVVFANLAGRKTNVDLTAATKQIVALVRQAQSDSMAQEGGFTWGILFSNATPTPFYSLFTKSPQAIGTTTVAIYRLPSTVAYQTSTLGLGSSSAITFSQITGLASASETIGLYMPYQAASFSSTISIASSGAVSY